MSTQRVITIYATKGGMKEITTDVMTYGELKPLMKNEGYDLKNLAATCGTTRNTLERDDAQLQEGDCTIFLRPVKTKSGLKTKLTADSKRAEVNAEVKELVAKYGDDFKAHLNSTGNWTRVKTPEVVALIESYNGKGGSKTSPSKKTSTPAKKAEKKTATKSSKKSSNKAESNASVEEVDATSNEDAFLVARTILEKAGMSSEVLESFDEWAAGHSEAAAEAIAAKEAEEAEAKRKAEKEAALRAEFDSL